MDIVADGLHQMSFAQSDPAIDEKGVVGVSGVSADGNGCVGGKAVVFGDNILVKSVVIPQLRMPGLGRFLLRERLESGQ